MKSVAHIRAINNSALLSYVYFNPIFRATRLMRRKLRRQLKGNTRVARLRTY